jgi:hypothetical protein
MLGRIADVHGIGAALFLIGIVPLLGAALGMGVKTQRT